MKVGITGSNGLIGKSLVRELIETQDISQLTREHTSPVSWKLPIDTDAIVHCAAYMPANFGCFSEATKCMIDNGLATLELLKLADKIGVKTFIYLSSGQIYKWKDDPNELATELDIIDPTIRSCPYLISKMVGDCYVRSYKPSNTMRIVVLRLSSVYGEKHGLLDRLVDMVEKKNLIYQITMLIW